MSSKTQKHFIIITLFLIFIFPTFPTECKAPSNSCKICSENSYSCDNTYDIRKGSYGRYCFYPDDSVLNSELSEIVPFSLPPIPKFPHQNTIQELKNIKGTFNSEYGGCSLSYSNGKISANFRYTKDTEPSCGDYKSSQQVNKFKCYCDKENDPNNFDFSTNVKITYQLVGGKCPESSTSSPCKQTTENIKIGTTEGYSIINKINEFENLVSSRDSRVGIANFKLKISAEITDAKCSNNEKNRGKLTPKVVKELSNY